MDYPCNHLGDERLSVSTITSLLLILAAQCRNFNKISIERHQPSKAEYHMDGLDNAKRTGNLHARLHVAVASNPLVECRSMPELCPMINRLTGPEANP